MAPTRANLGGDAWALLLEATPGASLPYPFRAQDRPSLDAGLRVANERALRDAGLLVGESGHLLSDLAPWLRAGLLAHARPDVVVDSSIGIGDMLRIAHHAIRDDVASGLVSSQRPADADELELGPIELSVVPAADAARDLLRGFGGLEGGPTRAAVTLDGAASEAVARALDDDRPDRARAVVERQAALGGGLRAVALVDVTGPAGRRRLIGARASGGWWIVARAGEDVVLRPVGEDALVAELSSALARD